MSNKFKGVGRSGGSHHSSIRGGGGMKNMSKLLKQAQETQKKVAEAQEKLKNIEMNVSVGGEAITIKGNCDYEVKEIEIKQDVIEDSEMLKDLLITAFNEYTRGVKERVNTEMNAATGGLDIPF